MTSAQHGPSNSQVTDKGEIVADTDPNAPKIDQAARTRHLRTAEGAALRADNLIAGYLPGVNILNGADLYCQPGC